MDLTLEKAKKLYPDAPHWFRKELAKEFGTDLIPDIRDMIKTFEDACNKLELVPDYVFHKLDQPDEIAYKKLKVIVKALNEGWEPDWGNKDQKKFYPGFNMSENFGLSYLSGDHMDLHSTVGNKLCFKSWKLAEYAGKQFKSIYKEFML